MKLVKVQKIFTILIVLLPFLYQYRSPVGAVSLGEFLLLPIMLLLLTKNIKKTVKYKPFNGLYTYMIIAVLTSMVSSVQTFFSYSEFSTILFRIIYYSVLIYIAYDNCDVDYGLHIAEYSAIIFSLYAMLQFIVHSIYGTILPTVINTNWVFSPEIGLRINYDLYYKYTYRASSLFLEPSYFSLFSGLGLTSSLFNIKKKKENIIGALIITLGIIVSASSAGLMLIVINWFFYFVYSYVGKKKKFTYKTLLITLVFMTFAVYVFSSSMSTTLLTRTASGGSFNNRVTRGFIIAKDMNLFQQTFGVGINNLENFVKFKSISTLYDEVNLNYVSSLIGTYICSGIITLICYIRFYIKSWISKFNNAISRVLIPSLFFISAVEMNSYSYRFAFYVIFILGMQRKVQQTMEKLL